MLIKCWGSRGSIPVSGPEYIKYGGDTTCIEIRSKSGDLIIVDAGTGVRRLGNALVNEEKTVYHFLFTHSHWDHLIGFPFFKPLYRSDSDIQIYRCPFPGRFIEEIVNKLMGPPHFPVRYSDLKAKITYKEGCPSEFQIGSVTVIPISLSHPNGGCGYKFIEDGKAFVFLTDNELGYVHPHGLRSEDYAILCENATLLFHDAEYSPEEYEKSIEWGHSTYTDALEMATKARVERLGLFHHNRERTDAQIDQIESHCRRIIEESGGELDCFAVGRDMTFEV
ncbi:MAG: MBL fold metallo-hydrolase [Desulfobacteraceae bacterium]|nr:MAG: MBL fold metallo-hydrolase [Desulfobacteraceae bacterium]